MRRVLFLTGRHRTPARNAMLAYALAFNAGAINAGGFLLVGMYTSHMTGFASIVADNAVVGNLTLVLSAVGALLAFISGSAVTAILVNWARRRRLRSAFALPLMLEAALLLVFGLVGAHLNRKTPFAVPLTVLLLAFTMGLQNALVSKLSSAHIRTTHMTGNVTDLGIELGKLVYWNRAGTPPEARVRANRANLRLYATLVGLFIGGGMVGAAGFKYAGFVWVVPQAVLLLALSLPPLIHDLRGKRMRRAGRRRARRDLQLRPRDDTP